MLLFLQFGYLICGYEGGKFDKIGYDANNIASSTHICQNQINHSC